MLMPESKCDELYKYVKILGNIHRTRLDTDNFFLQK